MPRFILRGAATRRAPLKCTTPTLFPRHARDFGTESGIDARNSF
jgi:hypothetical protein